jgi:N-acyl-D-amino-acid deacylase
MDAAEAFGTSIPPGYDNMVRYAMGLQLDFDPGTKYSYSNYGFMVLARVVERVTGRRFEDVVRDEVLAPLGIVRMAVGRTRFEDRNPGEVRYYDAPRAPLVRSLLPGVRRLLPMPYANFELDAADGSGRWIGSAVDLARLVARVEGSRAPALFGAETLHVLWERPEPFVSQDATGGSWYALGTLAIPYGGGMAWTHGGFYPGAVAGYESFGNGYLFAFVFNATPDNDSFQNSVYARLEAVGLNLQAWPSHDLFSKYYPE